MIRADVTRHPEGAVRFAWLVVLCLAGAAILGFGLLAVLFTGGSPERGGHQQQVPAPTSPDGQAGDDQLDDEQQTPATKPA